MTAHVLTVFMMLANGGIVETRVGVIVDKPVCDLAGLAIAQVLVDTDPSLTVSWTCEPDGVAA